MKIAILGDLFVPQPEKVIIDYSVKDVLSSCDFRIINLEAPIEDGKNNTVQKSGPIIKHPESIVDFLSELKIDALTLANNHIMDAGESGFHYTKKKLNDYLLMGAGCWEDAYQLHVIENNGLKIGFLNLCEMQFGMLSDEWTQGEGSIGCAWVNHAKANQLIVKSATEVDFLVAIVHAGLEMIDVPLPEWRNRYREMIDMGCDAIIAHHPHIVQGYEIYKGKPICYSLGNFCFNGGVSNSLIDWNIGALAILDFNKNDLSLNLKGCQFKDNCLRLVEQDAWEKKIDQLCQYLNVNYYMERVNDSCKIMMHDYWNLFAMGGLFSPKAFSIKNLARLPLHKYDDVHLLNNLQCESHRWCICRALRNENQYWCETKYKKVYSKNYR